MSAEYNSDHPEVIKAKAEAEARLLEARAKLSPAGQVADSLVSGIMSALSTCGCLLLIAVLILAFFAPIVLQKLVGVHP